MAGYVGKYGQRSVSYEIVLKDGKLFLKQGENEVPITKVDDNRFAATLPGSLRPMQFSLVSGADGKVEYLHAGLRASRRIAK